MVISLSYKKCLFKSFVHFKIGFIFLVVEVLSIFWILTPYHICNFRYYSHFVDCHFILFIVSSYAQKLTQVQSLDWEDPRRRKWLPTRVFLPGEFHGWRSLAVHEDAESDTTEQLSLSLHFTFSILLGSYFYAHNSMR